MKPCVLIVAFLALATTIDFFKAQCYNKTPLGTIVSLDVSPCPGANAEHPMCHFPRGQNVTLRATFTSPVEITAAKPLVYAHLGILTVPEPFHMEQDACQHFDQACPLAPDTQYTYTASVYISPVYPSISVVAEWHIHDQDDNAIICFAVPAKVVD